MKLKAILAMSLLSLMLIMLSDSEFSQKMIERHDVEPFNVPSSIGTKDDPYARARYDWIRLRNPKSNIIPKKIREKEIAFLSHLYYKVMEWGVT